MQVQNLDKWVKKYPNGIPHNDFQKRTEEKRRSGNGHATFLLNKQNAGAFDSWQTINITMSKAKNLKETNLTMPPPEF